MISRASAWTALVCMCLAAPVYGDSGGSTAASSRSSDYKKAVKAIKKEDFAGAAELLQKVVEDQPDNADAWNHFGYSLRTCRISTRRSPRTRTRFGSSQAQGRP